MNRNEILSKKGKAMKKEIKTIDYEESIENPKILNSILRSNLNSHNVMKSLNSEISNKIKTNIALDIFNNNANTLSSLLSKKYINGGSFAKTPVSRQKTEMTPKTIEIYGNHHHYFGHPLKEINNGVNNINNTNIENYYIGQLNTNTIDNNRRNYILYNNSKLYFSPYLQNNGKKEKNLYNKNNGYDNKIYETELNIINNKTKTIKNINGYEERNQKKILNNTNIKEINEIKEEKEDQSNKIKNNIKIYIKKAIKSNLNNNITKKQKEKKEKKAHSSKISRMPIYNGKKDVENNKDISYEEKEKEKYLSLLNNYRKRVIKQFMFYFKPYCNSFVKKYFNIFISNLKNIKNNNKSKLKRYIKKINKRNIYDNWKGIKDLKLIQSNHNNHNFTNNTSNNDIENSNNYINSYNSKKNQSEKDSSNPIKKINNFLINNNNINFSTKENLKNKNLSKNRNNELYRNNIELLKKYSQIIQRRRRKKMMSNNYINDDYSNYHLKNEIKTIDISLNNSKNFTINNSYERSYKIDYSPNSVELMNSYNSITNGEVTKEESIKLDENYTTKIRSMPKRQKVKRNKIKDKTKLKSPINSRPLSLKRKGENKNNKNIIIHKKNNKIIIIGRNEKINDINNSHYNKNYVSKTIKNIFTRDRKINIHINYVFFVPAKNKDKKKYEKNNKYMKITKNYSLTYIGNYNRNQNKIKINSKKKLKSIKEEEEKSKCSISMSMILQNTKTIDEYNSIINYLIDKIHNYYILRMKTFFLYNLKVINLSYQLNTILKNNIFKRIKFANKDNKDNKNDNKLEYNYIKNNSNTKFLLDDKITMNINNDSFFE